MLALTIPSDDGKAWRPAFKISEKAGPITYISDQEYDCPRIAEAAAAELVDGFLLAVMEAAVKNGFTLVFVGEDGTVTSA